MPPEQLKNLRNLSARQYAIYCALLKIAEEFGQFDWFGADGADYRSAADNTLAASGIQCANCAFFSGAGQCSIVSGPVDPNGACRLHLVPASLLVEPMVYEIRGEDGATIQRSITGPVSKIVTITKLEERENGGRILISTPSVDRDQDRVMPLGGRLDDYLKNPVVQWGHNYYDPWSTIGRSNTLEVTKEGIVADFDLRPAANEHDPQNIILLLWNQNYVRTASIGFRPEEAKPNEIGGLDFLKWSLLEWSLVPIPANQDALRLAAKSFPKALPEFLKRGRVFSRANESELRSIHTSLGEMHQRVGGLLGQLGEMPADEEPEDEDQPEEAPEDEGKSLDQGDTTVVLAVEPASEPEPAAQTAATSSPDETPVVEPAALDIDTPEFTAGLDRFVAALKGALN